MSAFIEDKLAAFIKLKREDAGLSGRQLARKAGYGMTIVHRIESCGSKPSLISVYHLFEALGTNFNEFDLFINEDKNENKPKTI